MTIDLLTYAISTFGTFIVSIYIFWRAINHSPSAPKKVASILWCLGWAFFDAYNPPWIPLFMVRTIFCAATVILLWKLSKHKIDTVVSAYLLSYGASYPLFIIAAVSITSIFAPFLGAEAFYYSLVDFNDPIYLLFYALIATLQFFIAYRFFKIRRFKRGFPFLSGRFTVVAALIVTGIVLPIVSFLAALRESFGTYHIVFPITAGVIIVGAGIVIWVRIGIKLHFKKKQEQRNDDILQQENNKLAFENKQLQDINETIRTENHSINHRLATLERNYMRKIELVRKYVPAEISDELAVDIETVRRLSQEYQKKINRVKVEPILPSTNIQSVDDLFALFAERFSDSEIEFMLKIKGSIIYMAENVISQATLETMIGDHLQNALVAINANKGSFRNVRATIGKVGEYYEFTIHDSGIPFKVDTLIRLGTERVTTYAGEGGSGVGFMKTFKSMRECGASLIIKENRGGIFSKSVTIRFNGLNQYIIETYRPEDFPDSDRYTVIGHSS